MAQFFIRRPIVAIVIALGAALGILLLAADFPLALLFLVAQFFFVDF